MVQFLKWRCPFKVSFSCWKPCASAAQFHRNLDKQNPLPLPDRDRPLHGAIRDLGRSLSPSRADDEIDEWSIYDESFGRLVTWAEEGGRFHEGLQALMEGGREHDLTCDSATAIALLTGI